MNEYAFDHRPPKFRGQPRRKPALNFGPRGYLKLMADAIVRRSAGRLNFTGPPTRES